MEMLAIGPGFKTQPYCQYAPSERDDCGYEGITKRDCQSRGCCFDSLISSGPQCFFKRIGLPNYYYTIAKRAQHCDDACNAVGKTCDHSDLWLLGDEGMKLLFFELGDDTYPYLSFTTYPYAHWGDAPNYMGDSSYSFGDFESGTVTALGWKYTGVKSFCSAVNPSSGKRYRRICQCTEKQPFCEHPVAEQKECGYAGISGEECRSRSCCFNAFAYNQSKCYHKLERPYCEHPVAERKNCGYIGIPESQCDSRGCCFDVSASSGHQCFFKNIGLADHYYTIAEKLQHCDDACGIVGKVCDHSDIWDMGNGGMKMLFSQLGDASYPQLSFNVYPTVAYHDSPLYLDSDYSDRLRNYERRGVLAVGWQRYADVNSFCSEINTYSGQYYRRICQCTELCPELSLVNGRVVYSPDSKAKVIVAYFTCNKDYHIQGSALLTCLSNGTWSMPPPNCQTCNKMPWMMVDGHCWHIMVLGIMTTILASIGLAVTAIGRLLLK